MRQSEAVSGMDNTINSDLIRGHINTIILKALYDGDRYGYDIIKDIEQKSSGQYTLKQPTLYSCLKRLESQGFISSYWGAKSNGGRRKYYTLTDMGRELFLKNQTDWEYSRTVIDKLISDKTFDLSAVSSDSAAPVSDMTDEEIERAFNDDPEVSDASEQAPDTVPRTVTVPADDSERHLREALDTAQLMNRLFEQKVRDAENDSYTETLFNAPYTASQAPHADDYFHDFPVEDEPIAPAEPPVAASAPVETPTYEHQAPAKTLADILADSPPTPYKPFYYTELADRQADDVPDDVAPMPEPQAEDDGFLHYDADVATDESALVIHREYKNILGDLFQAPPAPPEEPPVEEPDEVAAAAADLPQDEQQRNFMRLENNIRDLGDGITIRTHNSGAAKEYSANNYYYANKLMLYHYGFLFGITVLEMVILFLFIRVGLGIKQTVGAFQFDLLLYGLAIAGTLVFPVVAAVLNFRDPDRRKRINFSLKSSLVFRCALTVVCAILVYLVNLFCGMSLTSISGFVPSLFIPWVLCLNFPLSSLIFYLLFSSSKFSVN